MPETDRDRARQASRRHAMTAISLFAGAGGMDVGIGQAGIRTLCAIEADACCGATLRRNDSRKVVWQADPGVIEPARAMAALGLNSGELGLLACGPPTRALGSNDPAPEHAVREVVRFARVFQPRAIFIEQPPSFLPMRTSAGSHLLEVLRAHLAELGYDTHADMLDASAHGIAQHRRRAVVVAVPKGRPFGLATLATGQPPPTVGEAFEGLPAPTRPGDAVAAPNHVDTTPARARERIGYVPEGLWLAKSPRVPAEILGRLTRKDSTKFRRLSRSAPAPTLHADEALFHPIADRYITPREAARLQGFPDQYVFEGPILGRTGRVKPVDQYRQVATAVPPPLARSVARDLRRIVAAR